MPSEKIIAVVGATGAQGGGLVRAICADPAGGFRARALTRDPNTDKAKALAALGAEVVAADADEPATLQRAFEGAYGAYCVTSSGITFRLKRSTPTPPRWPPQPSRLACGT